MKHIAILIHKNERLDQPRYFMHEMAEVWKSEGFQVTLLQGPEHYIDADLVILHVNLTTIPDDYLRFIQQYPVIINGSVKDISKRLISKNIVRFGNQYDGPVILKTNRNYRGLPEAERTRPQGQLDKIFKKLLSSMFSETLDNYTVYDSVKQIPLMVRWNRNYIIEKFLSEMHDGYYCLRIWVFFGDKETNSICYSKEPVVKAHNVVRREVVKEVPDELRKIREEMGFDFGKFDYAIVNGEVILYDVNRTPTLGVFPREIFMPNIRVLVEGIYDYLPKENSGEEGHWQKIASLWKQIGEPLRPSKQDIHFFETEINAWSRDNGAPRALILGVTPELYHLTWPEGADIKAVDHTQNMIDALWPGPKNDAICADWINIPLDNNARDIVLCDGGIHLMRYPDDHRVFVKTMYRIVSPGGLCLFRLFMPPNEQEAVNDVLDDLLASKIPNLNNLKLRLGMALQRNNNEGVALAKVWETLHQAAPDFKELADNIGWSLEHLQAINTYRDSPNIYYFLTLDDVLRLFCEDPGGFTFERIHKPDYELGERCPTVVLRKLPSADN